MSDQDHDHDGEMSLVVPFLTDDPVFAYGVEFGILYERMKVEREIAEPFHRDNQDRILLLASRLRWTVGKIKEIDKCWFYLEMTAPEPPHE